MIDELKILKDLNEKQQIDSLQNTYEGLKQFTYPTIYFAIAQFVEYL